MVGTLDPDGPEPRDEPPANPARGELWLHTRRDGRLTLEGWLDPEHGSLVRALIEQLATRRPTTDGVADLRTVPQRQADALIELCERARATDESPTTGGEPPHVTVTIDWDALRTGLGAATLEPISAAAARRLACDCRLIPVVMGGDSEPLDVGRAMRDLKPLHSAWVIGVGHAFVQNLRRGHYELGVGIDRRSWLPAAFTELVVAI